MKEYRLRLDVERAVIDGFALALGFEPGKLKAPREGYTIAYNAGEGDDPDTYTFQVVASHEKLPDLLNRCFGLLPEQVFAIVEIGSRDAYRSVDVYLGAEPVSRSIFHQVWKHYEGFLLEDGSIAAGANSDDPFVEIFVDQHKSIILHVPLSMQDEVEELLVQTGLEQVTETWPDIEPTDPNDVPRIRPVLDVSDAYCPDVDELLMQLRQNWNLQLNLDPDSNCDEGGRELGMTLWHAVVIASGRDDEQAGAYISLWLTARSLTQTEQLIMDELDNRPQWHFNEFYTVDRVAHDERPDELADLTPRRSTAEVHLVTVEPWTDPAEAQSND